MWGTATVRGEEDVVVRRLNFDHEHHWKTERSVAGHVLHTDEDVEGFVANDWSWLERRSRRNPEGEPYKEWQTLGDPFYNVAVGATWDSWGFGVSLDRQYGDVYQEDWWVLQFSFGPFQLTTQRVWNKR